MNLTTVIVVPLLSGIGGWLGSFLNGYSSEKGKNLATHEDIDKIVEQVKAVTQTAKEIEAKISDQVWDRQRRWEVKRDQVMKMLDQATDARHQLTHLDATLQNTRTFGESEELVKRLDEASARFNSSVDDLERLGMTATLFCSPEAVHAITAYTTSLRESAAEIFTGSTLDFENPPHNLLPQNFLEVLRLLGAELS